MQASFVQLVTIALLEVQLILLNAQVVLFVLLEVLLQRIVRQRHVQITVRAVRLVIIVHLVDTLPCVLRDPIVQMEHQ